MRRSEAVRVWGELMRGLCESVGMCGLETCDGDGMGRGRVEGMDGRLWCCGRWVWKGDRGFARLGLVFRGVGLGVL